MKVAVIGLGYVGISLAGYFSEKHHIIGFDVNKEKVEEYQGLQIVKICIFILKPLSFL